MYTFLLPSRKSVQALPAVILGQIADHNVATPFFILIKKQAALSVSCGSLVMFEHC